MALNLKILTTLALLLHEKYFFSTKLEQIKIPFSIRKLTNFITLISIDVLEYDLNTKETCLSDKKGF